MTQHKIEIKLATQPEHFSEARFLILDYVAWLGMDLSFQNFDKEMGALAAMYNELDGGLYIAYLDDKAVGVAGLRRFSDAESEVKRMFVSPAGRGLGIGKLLLEKCVETARRLDYRTVKLDTADFMKAAIKLYTDHGFVEIPAYRFNPHEQARYFELDLTK
jgi:carbonic anhydrase